MGEGGHNEDLHTEESQLAIAVLDIISLKVDSISELLDELCSINDQAKHLKMLIHVIM